MDAEHLKQSRIDDIHHRALMAARDDEGKGGGVTPVKDILDRAAAYVAFLRDGPAPPETKPEGGKRW